MNTFYKYRKSFFLLILLLTFSCLDNNKALNDINTLKSDPIGIAYNIRMVYTDSMRVSAILTANKHVDFTNLPFKYSEFPEGVKVIFFDELNNQNEVT